MAATPWGVALQDVAQFGAAVGLNLFLVTTILLTSGMAAARLSWRKGALLQNTILRVTLLCLFLSPVFVLFLPALDDSAPKAGPSEIVATNSGAPAPSGDSGRGFGGGLVLTPALVFVLLWPAVAALRFLFLCCQGVLDSHLLRREAEEVTDPDMLEEFDRCAESVGVAPPRLVATPVTTSPLHAGVFSKVVVLPLTKDCPLGNRSIFLHELSHVRRGDNGWHLLTRLARSIFWFQPLLWKPGLLVPTVWEHLSFPRLLHETCENAADDLPLASGVDPFEYAETLVNVTEYQIKELAARRRWMGIADLLGAAMASPSELRLKRRLDRVTDSRRLLAAPAPMPIVGLILLAGLTLGFAAATWSEVLAGDPTPPRHLWSGRRYVATKVITNGIVTPESSWTYLGFQDVAVRLVDEQLRLSGRFQIYNVSNPEGEIDQVMLAVGNQVVDVCFDGNPGAAPGVSRMFDAQVSLAGWSDDLLDIKMVRVATPSAEQGVRLFEREGGGASFPLARLHRRASPASGP